MTREQQATLGQIAVWVGTAQELLQQAKSAAYANGMDGVVPVAARLSITDAAQASTLAAQGLEQALKAQEVAHE